MPLSVTRLVSRVGAPALALGAAAIAVIVLAAALLAQASTAYEMERRAAQAAAEAQAIGYSGAALLQAVTDAETGQRGFLLTGRAEFLSSYEQGHAQVDEALAALAAHARQQPIYGRSIPEIAEHTNRRMEILTRTLKLAGDGRREEALALVPEGGSVMADLRRRVEALVASARAREVAVRDERRTFDQRSWRLGAGLVAATVLALLVAIAALAHERITAARAASVRARMTEALEAARLRAVEADEAKSRFLAAASHDMRQPLHALALYISTLERRVESDQAREVLANMDGAVRSMSRLFTALLDLARLEAGILKPEPIIFDVHDLLHEVASQSVDPRGAPARIRVVGTTLRAFSDPDLLEIALRNLVSNAVKHSKGGRVLLGCRRRGDEIRIEVHDDGQGIPKDQLQRLFAEFVRGEQAGSTEGVGLGLAIVERMAKLLGHGLTVRSEVGRGTVFGIALPRARAPTRPASASEPARLATLAGVRVLLADDEPLALDAMRRALEDAGAKVTTAESAEDVRAHADGAFDLYVLDLNLGPDSGLRLLTELDGRAGRRVPSLIVTGATTADALADLRRAGRAWLNKPVTAAALAVAASQAMAQA